MIPDFEKRLNDKMEQASLNELMPDFDSAQEWQQLELKLQPAKKRLPVPVWAYAAAILILLAVGAGAWYMTGNSEHEIARQANAPATNDAIAAPVIKDTNEANNVVVNTPESKIEIAAAQKHNTDHKRNAATHKYSSSDIIYNGTPCPIEVRINQMMSCPNNQPKAITSSSTLEPDQSAELNYKATKAIARDCSLTIKEIEIKSIATGEVILLNSSSYPSTAQEVFSYITREKQGAVLAGMFNYDCEKKNRKHSLKLNNRDGNLILE